MESKPTILVAGATGYTGSHIVRALHDAGYRVRALARDGGRLEAVRDACDEVFVGEATRMETLDGLCDGVDVVVSSLGLRTFRARPTPEEVDLQANLNVLARAQKAGVRRFVFVSVLRADELMEEAPILRPREEFVRGLKDSGLCWTVLRPTGRSTIWRRSSGWHSGAGASSWETETTRSTPSTRPTSGRWRCGPSPTHRSTTRSPGSGGRRPTRKGE